MLRSTLIPDKVLDDATTFGFDQYTNTLARIIADLNTETPLTIGIHGGWGQGKTSLMKTLEKKLREGNVPKSSDTDDFIPVKVKTVWFNAWEYEKEQPIWTALVQRLANVLEKETEGKKEKITKFVGGVTTLLIDAGLRRFAGGLSLSDVKDHFKEYPDIVDAIGSIRDSFSEAIGEYLSKNDYKRIVVFLDDLDRCNIENVIDILDAIKLFLHTEGCIFILGVDLEKVEIAASFRYKEGEETGRNYLEKIIQFRFELPPIESKDFKLFVKYLVPEGFKNEYIEIICRGIPCNPRKAKQLLNSIIFQKNLISYKNIEINEKLLVLWLVLKFSFPKFSQEIEVNLERKPNLFREYIDVAKRSRVDKAYDKVSEIEIGKDLKPEFRDDDSLNYILKTVPEHITDEDIKQVIYLTKVTPGLIKDLSINQLSRKEIIRRAKLKQSFEGMNLRRLDLRDVDFSGCDMLNVNLEFSNLDWTELSTADLSHANLRGANLNGANLIKATLYGANLIGAVLREANLSDANLRNIDLSHADLFGAHFEGIKYNNKTLFTILESINWYDAYWDVSVEKKLEELEKKKKKNT